MSKDNSDYKKSMQQGTSKITIADDSRQKSMGGNVPGSREDSITKQNASKKKNKK
jgi:hypothetical protein